MVPTAIGSADFVRDPAVVTDELLERSIRRLRGMPRADRRSLAAVVAPQPPVAVAGVGA